MEIKLIHILGPVFATVAMFFYGKAIVKRSRGKQVNIVPTLIMIAGSLAFVWLTGHGTFLDRVCLTLLDFGIAMLIDSRYLAKHREHPKMFWVPGFLAVFISLSIWGIVYMFGLEMSTMWVPSEKSNVKTEAAAPIPAAPKTVQYQSHAANISSGEILIELGPDDLISELEGMMEKFGGKYRRAFPMISAEEDNDLSQFFLVDVNDDQVDEFLAAARLDKENIDAAQLNGVVNLEEPITSEVSFEGDGESYVSNDPDISKQWWLDAGSANAMHAILKENKPKKKAIIAIIDTGVDGGHEDLSGIFGKSPGNSDIHGHGTHCAGLAGGATNNGIGIASFNWEGQYVEVRGYKALGDDGQGSDFTVAEAMLKAVEDGADVLSMSLGSNRPAPKVTLEAVSYALSKNCIVVCAAGNDHGNDARNHSPVSIDGVIAVAATTPEGTRAEFSNTNTSLKMPIAAPGKDIYSTMPNGEYEFMSGTSMATPIVSGLIGVMRALKPDLDAKTAWKILRDSGKQGGDASDIGNTIDPVAALQALMAS